MNPTSSSAALFAALIGTSAAGFAVAQTAAPAPAQEITRAGAQPSASGPAEFFTGRTGGGGLCTRGRDLLRGGRRGLCRRSPCCAGKGTRTV